MPLKPAVGAMKRTTWVFATGLFQKPKFPAFNSDFPSEIKQIHSDEYRNPKSVPDGAILVVSCRRSEFREPLHREALRRMFRQSSEGFQ
jgi:putative flavoprotein involved in K+ transport